MTFGLFNKLKLIMPRGEVLVSTCQFQVSLKSYTYALRPGRRTPGPATDT